MNKERMMIYAMNCEGVIGEFEAADKVAENPTIKAGKVFSGIFEQYECPLWLSTSVEALHTALARENAKAIRVPVNPIVFSRPVGSYLY